MSLEEDMKELVDKHQLLDLTAVTRDERRWDRGEIVRVSQPSIWSDDQSLVVRKDEWGL